MKVLGIRSHENSPVGMPRSFPPLPKPFCTAPDRKIGNGGSTLSGPTISGRDFLNVSVRRGAEGLADDAWRSSAVLSGVVVMVRGNKEVQ
jgi:hypothetical protein